MQAFHNDPAIQAMYLARVKAHYEADEIIQGTYWENGKGCAVGCTIHSSNHNRYKDELGIPRQLAYLQDRLFEGMSNEDAKRFPVAFLEAIPLGADLSLVVPHFLVWLLADSKQGVIRFADEQGKAVIERVVSFYQRVIAGDTPTEQEWNSAYQQARRAYAAADAAAAAAAYDAADAAADAADAAAYAAARAAYDAAAAAADADAREKHYRVMADKLLDLLSHAPVAETIGVQA